MQCAAFVSGFSHRASSLRLIRVVVGVRVSFLFTAEQCSVVWIDVFCASTRPPVDVGLFPVCREESCCHGHLCFCVYMSICFCCWVPGSHLRSCRLFPGWLCRSCSHHPVSEWVGNPHMGYFEHCSGSLGWELGQDSNLGKLRHKEWRSGPQSCPLQAQSCTAGGSVLSPPSFPDLPCHSCC
jgi:hypothetical protein